MSLHFRFPKVYPITDPYISGISHLEQVARLIRGGAQLIQLRDKRAVPAAFFAAAAECVALAHRHGVRIVVNDRVDIAKAVQADGVHLGQDDIPAREARRILGENVVIGLSTHSARQAQQALEEPIDYIAVGPIFNTVTKDDSDPVVGIAGVRSIRSVIGDITLVAIGGIDAQNVNDVLGAGADSAAIIGGVIREPDSITEKTKTLLDLTAQ